MRYDTYKTVRLVVSMVSGVIAVAGLVHLSGIYDWLNDMGEGVFIVFITAVPPAWFFSEYLLIRLGWIGQPPEAELKVNERYEALASKFWAGVLASSLFLFAAQGQENLGECIESMPPQVERLSEKGLSGEIRRNLIIGG